MEGGSRGESMTRNNLPKRTQLMALNNAAVNYSESPGWVPVADPLQASGLYSYSMPWWPTACCGVLSTLEGGTDITIPNPAHSRASRGGVGIKIWHFERSCPLKIQKITKRTHFVSYHSQWGLLKNPQDVIARSADRKVGRRSNLNDNDLRKIEIASLRSQ